MFTDNSLIGVTQYMSLPDGKTALPSSKPYWDPKPYMKGAVLTMLQQACVGLFLDPGLGKTAISLSAFRILKEQGYVKRALVICPLRPAYLVWPKEIQKWADFSGLRYCVVHGDLKEEALDLDADIFITNVDSVPWLAQSGRFKRIGADVLIVDESTKFRHTNTERFKRIKPYIPRFKRRWILTGTPAPNGLMDLFGQIYLLDEGASLGRFISHYRTQYFFQSGYAGYTWSPLPQSADLIADKIRPLVVRLKAEDYLDMPELQSVTIKVQLPAPAYRIYRQVEEHFYSQLAGGAEIMAPSAASAGIKCRQVANGAVYDTEHEVREIHKAKIEAFNDLIEELSGQPVLVIYEFIHDRERLQKEVPGPYVGGGVSIKKTIELEAAFNAGTIPVLYGHSASVALGLNLQEAAHHIIFFGIPWDLELYDQTIDRLYRQGQKSSKVIVHHLVAEDTLDEKVMRVLSEKDRTQQKLLQSLAIPG